MAARELTLPSSGAVIRVRRIPTMLLDDYRRSLPEPPRPPTQAVEYDGVKKFEENPAHPDYAKAMSDYMADIGDRLFTFVVKFGVEVEVDAKAVADLRAWAQANGVQLPEDDKLVYVTRILAEGPDDLTAISEAVRGAFQPTEAAVEKTVESFPSPV